MPFTALLYHEIRESGALLAGQASPIEVRQDYEDFLPPALFVTLENFSEQMEYLAQNQYHTLSLSEVTDAYSGKAELPKKSVLLTFDDCYQSLARYAYPILKQHGFHAVAFVVTGWLNGQGRSFDPSRSVCLTEKDLAGMKDVFEYANHTDRFHTRENVERSASMKAGEEEFSKDLDRCSANPIISRKDVFAYPFGLYSPENVELLRRKGFRLAFTSQGGCNCRDTDPLLLRRNVVPYFMEFQAFLELLQ